MSPDHIFARQDVTNFEPSEHEPVLKQEAQPKQTVAETLFPREVLQHDKKLKGKTEPAATVSSIDQMAVSSVDLDISKTVEEEVLQTEGDSGRKGKGKEKEEMEEWREAEQDEKSVVSEGKKII